MEIITALKQLDNKSLLIGGVVVAVIVWALFIYPGQSLREDLTKACEISDYQAMVGDFGDAVMPSRIMATSGKPEEWLVAYSEQQKAIKANQGLYKMQQNLKRFETLCHKHKYQD